MRYFTYLTMCPNCGYEEELTSEFKYVKEEHTGRTCPFCGTEMIVIQNLRVYGGNGILWDYI